MNHVLVFREEARNMFRMQEDRWKSELSIRKTAVENMFTMIKNQVCTMYIIG